MQVEKLTVVEFLTLALKQRETLLVWAVFSARIHRHSHPEIAEGMAGMLSEFASRFPELTKITRALTGDPPAARAPARWPKLRSKLKPPKRT